MVPTLLYLLSYTHNANPNSSVTTYLPFQSNQPTAPKVHTRVSRPQYLKKESLQISNNPLCLTQKRLTVTASGIAHDLGYQEVDPGPIFGRAEVHPLKPQNPPTSVNHARTNGWISPDILMARS